MRAFSWMFCLLFGSVRVVDASESYEQLWKKQHSGYECRNIYKVPLEETKTAISLIDREYETVICLHATMLLQKWRNFFWHFQNKIKKKKFKKVKIQCGWFSSLNVEASTLDLCSTVLRCNLKSKYTPPILAPGSTVILLTRGLFIYIFLLHQRCYSQTPLLTSICSIWSTGWLYSHLKGPPTRFYLSTILLFVLYM